MRDRRLHVEELQLRLLAGHDHVDVVAAAQAVVGDRQQRVRVRRQVDADDLRLLVRHVVDEARVLVREAVVVLAPDVRGEQVVERRDRPPPRDAARHLQPLRVLVEHRVDDVDERLVAGEEPVPAGQQVALEPALALVLAQHLHHPPVRREVVVAGHDLRVPRAVGRLEQRREPVRGGLVGPEHAEVLHVRPHHVAQEAAEDARRLGGGDRRLGDVDGVVAEVRHPQVLQQLAAVGVRRGAHPLVALRHLAEDQLDRPAVRVEQLLRAVGAHPLLEPRHVGGVVGEPGERDLVGAEGALDLHAVDLAAARSSPSACAGRSSASAAARRGRRRRARRRAPRGSRRVRRRARPPAGGGPPRCRRW